MNNKYNICKETFLEYCKGLSNTPEKIMGMIGNNQFSTADNKLVISYLGYYTGQVSQCNFVFSQNTYEEWDEIDEDFKNQLIRLSTDSLVLSKDLICSHEGDFIRTPTLYFSDNFLALIWELQDLQDDSRVCNEITVFQIDKDIVDPGFLGVIKKYLRDSREFLEKKKKEQRVVSRLKYSRSDGKLVKERITLGTNLEIDIQNSYNTDLPDSRIRECLNKDRGGFFIFHGEPGTGKSTYLKYLIQSETNLDFVIIDNIVLQRYQEELSEYLTDNIKSKEIYIMEDCEKFIESRDSRTGNNFLGLGDLLNLTDGLLGDAVKAKFVCTFNSDLTNIDSALLRPGRLFVEYEFKRLTKDKTKYLLDSLGLSDDYRELTVAEIYNKEDSDISKKKKNTSKKIGF